MTSTVDDAGVVTRGPRLDRRRSARTQGVRRGRLTVYLTEEERSLLEARSEVSGESMAKILVDCALHPVSAGEGVDAGGAHEVVHARGGEAAAGEDGGGGGDDVGLGEGSGASHGI